MKCKWPPRALRQPVTAQNYTAQDSPVAANAIAKRINSAIELLLSQPDMGRPGRITGTRE